MHEQTLIKALLEQVEKIRCQHDAAMVTEVRVEVGPLSGVEPSLMASAFTRLVPDWDGVDANLVIDEVALLAACASCESEFELRGFVFRCPACDGNVRVVRGDSVQLVSVSLASDEPAQEPIS